MANIKISGLTAATTPLSGVEQFEAVQGGNSVRTTATDIANTYSSTLPVANGGTGRTTLSTGQYLKGAGTGGITSSATVPFTDLTGFQYAHLNSTVDQPASANTATVIYFDSPPTPANGITLVSNGTSMSRITVSQAGIYQIFINMLLSNVGAGNAIASLWLRKNGVNLANSNTDITVLAKSGAVNGTAIAAVPYIESLAASDYIEFVWSTPTADITIDYIGAQSTPTRPAAPSVIVNITRIA